MADILAEASKLKLNKEDIITALSNFTAYSIFTSYQNFIQPFSAVEEVVIGGGGAHNTFIMKQLQDFFKPAAVSGVSAFDLNEDFKEAIGFAILANETFAGNASNVMQVSGASRAAVLGKICFVK